MARPPKFSGEKLRIVLSVLRGEGSIAETARRERMSETSIARWRDLFVEGGARALAGGAARAGARSELERRLDQVTGALGEAHVELRLVRREGRGRGPFPELELIRARAGLSVRRFCELAGVSRATYYRWRDAAVSGTERRRGRCRCAAGSSRRRRSLHSSGRRGGTARSGRLLEADGFHASQATVRRALKARALLQPPGATRERRMLARSRKAAFRAPGRQAQPRVA